MKRKLTSSCARIGILLIILVSIAAQGMAGNAARPKSNAPPVCAGFHLNESLLTAARLNQPYRQEFTIRGGTAPYTFTINETLPTGISLTNNVLSGTPTQAGIFPFTLTVRDAGDCLLNENLTLVVGITTLSISSSGNCLGPGGRASTTFTVNNPYNGPIHVGAIFAMAAGNDVITSTCTVNTGLCHSTEEGIGEYAGVLEAGQMLTITIRGQIGDPEATNLCAVALFQINDLPLFYMLDCMDFTCTPVGPGTLANSTSPSSDQKMGSVLFYNLYSSSVDANRQNTRINLTNVNPSHSANVHLFFVDGSTCTVADSYICLTPNQTTSFLTSDIDPGTTGYLVAVATDDNCCPINFNYLIGDEYVKMASGHAANLSAEAISAIAGRASCGENSSLAALNFDGVNYNVVPRALSLDHIPSRGDGNDTLLLLNRIGGDLSTGAATLTGIFGILYDDAEVAASFSVSPGACQFRSSLSNSFPRTAPRFEQFIPAGRSGWLKLFSQSDQGLFGAAITFNAGADANSGHFNQGHNLHKLTNTATATITIPVFPPSC